MKVSLSIWHALPLTKSRLVFRNWCPLLEFRINLFIVMMISIDTMRQPKIKTYIVVCGLNLFYIILSPINKIMLSKNIVKKIHKFDDVIKERA